MAKLCVWLTKEMFDEMNEEAVRHERNMNWIIQRAWILAKGKIKCIPSFKKD